jgi:hypothetical protein
LTRYFFFFFNCRELYNKQTKEIYDY